MVNCCLKPHSDSGLRFNLNRLSLPLPHLVFYSGQLLCAQSLHEPRSSTFYLGCWGRDLGKGEGSLVILKTD